MQFYLRPYQQKAVDDIATFLKNRNPPSLVVMPTGSGKSYIIAEAAKMTQNTGNTLVLQHSSILLKQNYEKYIGYGFEASIFSASLKSLELGSTVFATPKTVMNNLDKFKNFNTIIIDEAHLGCLWSNDNGKIIKSLNPNHVLGFTATPVVNFSDGEVQELVMQTEVRAGIFKEIIHLTQISEIRDYWTKIKYLVPKMDLSLLRSKGLGFTESSVKMFYTANEMDTRIVNAINHGKSLNCKRFIVYCESIDYATIINQKILGSVVIHSKMKAKDVEMSIRSFKMGITPILININMVSIGFDLPELDMVVDASPTKSVQVYYQRVGRGVRLSDGKESFFYADLAGNYSRFGKVEDIVFVKDKKWSMFGSGGVDFTQKAKRIENNFANPNYVITFGKHKGKTIAELYKKDRRYLAWAMSDKFEPNFRDGIEFKNQLK